MTALTAISSPDRLAALRQLNLLDSPPLRPLDRLTDLAAQLLEAPIALLTLIDADRQFFLSSSGLPEPVKSHRQTALNYSVCQYAVAAGRPLIVDDARLDPDLAGSPAVIELGVTAYAGIPLVTADGHAVGALCVIDVAPRRWTGDHMATLAHLADITMDEIRLNRYRPMPRTTTATSSPTTR